MTCFGLKFCCKNRFMQVRILMLVLLVFSITAVLVLLVFSITAVVLLK
jgi:hypothetical protein